MTEDGRAAAARYALATVVVFLTLAVLVATGATEPLDEAAVTAATDVTRAYPWLLDALIVLEEVTRPVWLYALATVICIVAGWRLGMWRRAGAAWLTMMAVWGAAALLKLVVARERPTVAEAVWEHSGLSFPSGHATNSAAMTTAVLIMLAPLLGDGLRRGLALAAALLVVAVILDRVFLGVHYPSDVTAGVVLGGGLVLAASRLWPAARQNPAEHDPAQHDPAQHDPAQHVPAQRDPDANDPADEGAGSSVGTEPVRHRARRAGDEGGATS